MLVAVVGIFIYKASAAKDNAPNAIAAKDGSVFAIPQAAPNAASGTESQSEGIAEQNTADKSPVPQDKLMATNGAAPVVAKAGKKIGENLESLSALNKVAMNQDAVFIFIPALMGALPDEKTSAAVLSAQRALERSKITLGMYTLPVSSPDYAGISTQVQAPAILVACKGKGMAAVSGEVTETKLLQAFMSSSSAGGCGPSASGCGPSSAGCK